MPRVYKPDPRGKRYKRYSKELIEQALREYNEGSNSLSNVAEKYQINKSVLYRHTIKNVKTQGGQTVLSKETELAFIKYINVCAEWGYPMELFDLRILVKNYLDKLGVTEKRFKNNLPGPDFARSFLKRHSNIISQRVSQNIKRSRAAVSPDVIKEYFEQLKNSISDVPIENIVNYDERNLADDPGRKKIITKRGTKYPERVMNSSKAAVSIMMACTAAGEILPPYVVYKAQNLFDTWVKSGPKGARYNRNQSGWFDSNIFEDWVTSMIIPFFENKLGKKCLIGDNLSSHLSIDLIRKCYEKDIHFIFLPANSTHITQPLDVAFFRPVKIAWRNIILQWKKIDGRNQSSIPKGCFPKLLNKLMENLKENGSANVISGFRKTGINPFDPSAVLKKLPDWDNQAEQPEIVDETILDYLKEMRYGTNNIVEPKKKKKLQVQAGKSVLLSSDEDYIETTDPEYVPSLILKEKKQQRNEKILDGVTKGKGKGKKTKSNIKNDCKENDPPERENQLDNAVPSCSYNISPYDVNNMPVIFEDDLDGIGQIETIVENEENAPVPKEKKKQKNEKSMVGVSNKGKGKGKKTKTYNKTDCKENDPPKHENQQVDQTVACCSYNISPYDVNNMPVIFEDDLDVIEQIETIVKNNENENNSKKIEIISDVVVSDAEIKRLLNKPVPKSKSRRPSYYKNDADILKDLMELD